MPVEIGLFDPASASKTDLAEHYAVMTAVITLDHPGQTLPTLAGYTAQIRAATGFMGSIRRWVAREDGRVVGTAMVTEPERENRHLGVVRVTVLPERRREGIGTALLRAVLPGLADAGRTVVMGRGVKAEASGEMWARKLGFVRSHAYVRQSLSVSGADSALRQLWQRPVADGFRLESWTGAAPQALLAEYACARTAITDAPNGESSLEFKDWTPERVRAHEAEMRKRDVTHHVTVAVHEAGGRIAGLTELTMLDTDRRKAYQGDTAVSADFRGYGLGLAVKGATLRWLTAELPAVEEVHTTTAHNNEHMIRINLALGYVTTGAVAELETGTTELAERLAGRDSS